MSYEAQLANFVYAVQADELPVDVKRIARLLLMTTAGTAVAGAGQTGIAALRKLKLKQGGASEAKTFVFGDRLPASSVGLINGVMCRALDYCDAMAPGLHIGSSLVPAAFAAAELNEICTGAEFLAALVVGTEVASRFNLAESQYDGFDPTGVAAVFGATAAAARILRLNPEQIGNALALAFNRCAGSFQSNVDGSLAVRLIQGWVTETGIECALLAKEGFTGPARYLSGSYGYAHLYGRDTLDPRSVVDNLGDNWRLNEMVFKKYPSCGGTQGITELALNMAKKLGLQAQSVRAVEVRLRPYSYKLVGHDFKFGENIRVDAQFSAQYCVANAIVRHSSKLADFEPDAIRNPEISDLIKRIKVVPDEQLGESGNPRFVLRLQTVDGQTHENSLEIAPGFPGSELSDAEHLERFHACMAYAPWPLAAVQIENFLEQAQELEKVENATSILENLIVDGAA